MTAGKGDREYNGKRYHVGEPKVCTHGLRKLAIDGRTDYGLEGRGSY